jgi:hypothetical protein
MRQQSGPVKPRDLGCRDRLRLLPRRGRRAADHNRANRRHGRDPGGRVSAEIKGTTPCNCLCTGFARTRSGQPCQATAMPNGRCRMHGGTSPGAPKGNKNAFKHGRCKSARDHGALADDESPCEGYEGAGMNPPGPAQSDGSLNAPSRARPPCCGVEHGVGVVKLR